MHPLPLDPDSSRLETLYWGACVLPVSERGAFLDRACAGNPDLRRQLARMLSAEGHGFLETPLPELLAGDLPDALARWKLLERIGEGGLGVVYRAECVEDGVRLEAAIKVLRPGFDTGKFREKFVRERQILAGLDHPGIVRLMDCGADSDGRSYLVMEFVRGEPLHVWLEHSDAELPVRIALFESVCEAVSYLHSRLVVHGDIKPGNVLVTATGHPKLLDFGAASLAAPIVPGDLTRVMLTPRYASPEQKRGEGPSVAGDIYSLGRLLEEMVPAGSRPSDLRYIVRRATEEQPAARYLTVSSLLEDLRRLREGLPLRARPATAAYVTRRFLRRNWAVSLLTTLLIVSLAGGWWRAGRAGRRALESEARLATLVRQLIDDDDADPNIVGQQQAAAEMSLRRAAGSLEALPGPPRWREISIAWRRVAMILVHQGKFTTAEAPLQKAKEAAARWLGAGPSLASRRNALLVMLCELRLERQRNGNHSGYRLAHQALAEFDALPPEVQAELNGTVWLESARLSLARELIDLDRVDELPALLAEVVSHSHARGLTQTRNLAVAHLVWSYRRLDRLQAARRWCAVAREWQVDEARIPRFCAEPMTPFTVHDELFPAVPGILSPEDLRAIHSRIGQLVVDHHEDPRSFPLNLALGRAYARLAEHYLASGQPGLARPSTREAASIGDALLAADSASPVVQSFRRRVETIERSLKLTQR